jgi:hypothetical protein
MPWFRKKPVVIEAIQLTDTNSSEVASWCGGRTVAVAYDNQIVGVEIPTLEGNMLAGPGDFVIKGVKGEFYPCKYDIFIATYEDAAFTGFDE